jgi:hypothetical protein
MNYYGINRKVNVVGYVQGYKSPVTKRAENVEVVAQIPMPRDNNQMRMIEAFIQKYKMTAQSGIRINDPYGKTIDAYGKRGDVTALKEMLNG